MHASMMRVELIFAIAVLVASVCALPQAVLYPGVATVAEAGLENGLCHKLLIKLLDYILIYEVL